MRKILITITILFFAATASAQIILQRAVTSQAGGMASNGTINLQYTVSQTAVGMAANNQTVGQFGFWTAPITIASVHNSNGAGPIRSVSLFPNPAQGEVRIDLSLAASGSLDIILYDDAGKTIRTIYSGTSPAGSSSYRFDASQLASGSYFIAARMPGALLQTKLNVVK